MRVAITLCWNCGASRVRDSSALSVVTVEGASLGFITIGRCRRWSLGILCAATIGDNCRPAEVVDGMKFAADGGAFFPAVPVSDTDGIEGRDGAAGGIMQETYQNAACLGRLAMHQFN